MAYFLLPKLHLLAFAGSGLFRGVGFVTVRTTLGHAAIKCRRRVMHVPPVALAAGVTAVAGHGLQIERGA